MWVISVPKQTNSIAVSMCALSKQLVCWHNQPISKCCRFDNDNDFANIRASVNPHQYIHATKRNHVPNMYSC